MCPYKNPITSNSSKRANKVHQIYIELTRRAVS